jgi:L-rhamnonate dehydratase
MKITRVEAIPIRQSADVQFNNDSSQDGIIIKVYTDEGVIGYGEVDSSPLVVKAAIDAPTSHRMCRGLAEVIIGENPLEIDKLWEKMYQASTFFGRRGVTIHAMSGIDIALWDIKGKVLGQPIHELLGGAVRNRVRAYASTLMPYTPEEAYEETRKYCELGFTAIKLGWGGFEQNDRMIISLVEAAREAAGPDVDLMFDLGFIPTDDLVIDAASRVPLLRKLEPYNPYWIEEALYPDDLDGYRKLAESTPLRIACGENESTRYGFKTLIEQGGIDIIQPDVTRCGGLSEAKRIAQLAQAYNITCIPHAWSSGIVIAASMHLIASTPNSNLLEYCIFDTPIRREMLTEDIIVKDGYADISHKPGLGIEINEDAIEKYRMDK